MTTLLLWLVTYVPVALLRGWAIATMWGWYAVPLGAPSVSIAHAIGLTFLVGLFTARPPSAAAREAAKKNPLFEMAYSILFSALGSVTLVAFGWLWLQWR